MRLRLKKNLFRFEFLNKMSILFTIPFPTENFTPLFSQDALTVLLTSKLNLYEKNYFPVFCCHPFICL